MWQHSDVQHWSRLLRYSPASVRDYQCGWVQLHRQLQFLPVQQDDGAVFECETRGVLAGAV